MQFPSLDMLTGKLRKSLKAKPRPDIHSSPSSFAHTFMQMQLEPAGPNASVSRSPVSRLLACNDAPTEEEAVLIQQAIRRGEAELYELAKGTSVHRDHLWESGEKDKQATLARVKSFVRQHRVLLSAARRLPSEILQEILLCALVGQPTAEVRARRWELAQVSHTWRRAALGLSILWVELPPLRLPVPAPRAERQVACLQELLKRSGTAPLTLSLEIDPGSAASRGEKEKTMQWRAQVDLLVQHAERWETATICMSLPLFTGLRIRHRLKMLKTLSLQIRSTYHSLICDPLNMFENAPLLRRVHIGGAVPIGLKLPFAQLLHYKHLDCTDRTFSQIASYSSLESIMISQQVLNVPVFPAATLSWLRKIEIVSNLPAKDNAVQCFNALRAPALEELTVAFPFSSPSIIPSIITMLKASGPSPLKMLKLRPGTTEPLQLAALLELTPMLVSLDTSIPPHFDIEELANMGRRAPLVPNLRSCKFVFDFVIERYSEPPMVAALNRLARVRCETPMPRDRMELSLYSVYNQVDEGSWSHFKQRQLEGWASTPTSKTLEKINTTLAVSMRTWMQPKQERVLSLGKEQSVDKIRQAVADLGGVQVKSAKDIYISGAHATLKRLADVDPVHDKQGFALRAKAILQKWDPLIRANLGQIRWCCQGSYSLIYVPSNHACRVSLDPLGIAYGLKNEMTAEEARWPAHLGVFGISLHWPQRIPCFIRTDRS